MAKLMTVTQVCSAEVIAKSAVFTSEPFMVERAANFSLMVTDFAGTTPDGITITYSVCTSKDGTFIVPAGATAIFTALKTTGVANFSPVMAPFIKFIITNLDATDAVTISAKFIHQESVS